MSPQPPGPGSSEPQSEEDEGSGSFQLPSLDEPEEPARPARPAPPPPPQRVASLIAADDAPEPGIPPEEAAARLKRHHVPPAIIALDRIDADDTFRIRPAGDLDRLAQNLARLGQLFPVDLRPGRRIGSRSSAGSGGWRRSASSSGTRWWPGCTPTSPTTTPC